jgi:hypothetical protein
MEQFFVKVLLPALLRYLEQNPDVVARLVEALIKQIVEAIEKAIQDAQAGGQ